MSHNDTPHNKQPGTTDEPNNASIAYDGSTNRDGDGDEGASPGDDDGAGSDSPSELVDACPDCDDTQIHPLVANGKDKSEPKDHDYRCGNCGATLDEDDLVERERRGAASNYLGGGLAATLAGLDADAVGGGGDD